jgi:flagellar hook-length control protein FliK
MAALAQMKASAVEGGRPAAVRSAADVAAGEAEPHPASFQAVLDQVTAPAVQPKPAEGSVAVPRSKGDKVTAKQAARDGKVPEKKQAPAGKAAARGPAGRSHTASATQEQHMSPHAVAEGAKAVPPMPHAQQPQAVRPPAVTVKGGRTGQQMPASRGRASVAPAGRQPAAGAPSVPAKSPAAAAVPRHPPATAQAPAQRVAAAAMEPLQDKLPRLPRARTAAGQAAVPGATPAGARNAQMANATERPPAAAPRREPARAQPEQANAPESSGQPRHARASGPRATGATARSDAHATPTAQAAPPPAPKAPPDHAFRSAVQAHGRPHQPNAEAVAVQAWRRYDAQAGDGYRQQVQTLAGRTAGQMSAEIIRQAQLVRQSGAATVRMQLNPPEMGRIRLEVRMKSDRFEVRMQVEDPDVRQAMGRELAGLDRTLREAQVDVQRFELTDYGPWRQSPDRGDEQDGGPAAGGSPQLPAAGEQDEPALGWARISASGAVDCLI